MIERQDEMLQLEDVLINVLSKLPVKSLLRFRCVCKRWRYLISDDPYFFQLHHSHQSKSNQSILFNIWISLYPRSWTCRVESTDREGNSISKFQLGHMDFRPVSLPTRFDLVCMREGFMVHICNPATQEIISLPKLPSLFPGSVGFGYVQSTDEYKVVCLNKYLLNVGAASSSTKCRVFTLGLKRKSSSSSSSSSSSWVWRALMDSPYDISMYNCPAFVNGAIHWLVFYDTSMISNPSNLIIAFDVEREVFRLISYPQGFPDLRSLERYYDLKLVELKGLLCLTWVKDFNMDIWVFKDYCYESGSDSIRGTWVKEYSIDLNILDICYKGEDDKYEPRDIVEDTEVLIEITSRGYVKYLGYYHLKNKSFKRVRSNRDMEILRFSFYIESLRSLKQTSSP